MNKIAKLMNDNRMRVQYVLGPMNQAIGIGFFQVDNLIRNRIPLFIVSLNADLQDLYQGLERDHLDRHLCSMSENLDLNSLLEMIREKQLRSFDAILLVCAKGKLSQSLANQLANQGFANCYFVEGGFESLKAEANEEKSI